MRSLVWIGAVALLVSCSRDNPLFDLPGGGASGSDGMTGPGGPMSGTRGPDSGMPSADGGSAGVTSAPPPTTGGPGGNTDPPPPTTQGETSPPDDTGPTNDCCTATNMPGCNDPEVQACVCEGDPNCCASMWDDSCVEEVDAFECEGDCGTNFDSCCGYDSCEAQTIVTCACVEDESCCDDWSPHCAFISAHHCALEGCELPLQNCCEGAGLFEPGCSQLDVALCVCGLSEEMLGCCTVQWTEQCAMAAVDSCELVCP